MNSCGPNYIYSIYFGYLRAKNINVLELINNDIYISKFAGGIFKHLLGKFSIIEIDEHLDYVINFLRKYINNVSKN